MPTVRWGAWDRNWDHCQLTDKEVAKALKHDYPIKDYAENVRKIYREFVPSKREKDVERLIADAKSKDTLPALYRRAYLDHAYGGGTTRHIILVRALPCLEPESVA